MKILVMSRAVVGSRMASPGIRSYHMARVLAEALPQAEVTLAVPAETDLPTSALPFRVSVYDRRSLIGMVRGIDIIIAPGVPPYLLPFLLDKRVVLDLYSPYYWEWLAMSQGGVFLGSRRAWMQMNWRYLEMQLTLADFVLCANERQRDLYVGMLISLALIPPDVYDADPSLGNVFGVVPYGVRPGAPDHTRRVLKGVHPGIGENDKVLIWNGTIIEWYDTESLIRAVHQLSREREDIKLFFLGTEYPAAWTGGLIGGLGGGAVQAAVSLSRELGLLDRFVFFNSDWCSYEDTADYLLEADAGVCTYTDDTETRYAFRTRYVDLFWAELPIICTQGDVLAEMVDRMPLGVAVPPRDTASLAEAIRRVVDDTQFAESCKENLRRVCAEYQWERTLRPLIAFCERDQSAVRAKRGRFLALLGRSGAYARARLSHHIHMKVAWEYETLRDRFFSPEK